ncbi:ATP synthase F1 subunit gamma [Erysipelotrichaceae bacterium OH741_COT-311]|nr:ATP synthase F1 subunit gamma [Erysipelotrichaceae bacterium OH741_COT-311]
MAKNKQALKSRIKSINATIKITSAMELIANSKLLKQKEVMLKTKEYTEFLSSTINEILSSNKEIENQYLQVKDNPKSIYIVFCSDLGLCGGYNVNTNKVVKEVVRLEDEVILIGTKSYRFLKRNQYNIINPLTSSENITSEEIGKLATMALGKYIRNEVGSIKVIYTKYVNSVTFHAACKQILPYTASTDNVSYQETLFEPQPNEILDHFIPMMVKNEIFSLALQSKVSEQASRRMAMESATDNAMELKDTLTLEYNQARQAAITQEITEIVAGADAI